jgi:hypothetical protein
LTQASVLKVTADGNHTSPVKRGTWVVTQLLGRPLPPPPPSVPGLEPDTRGAKTIRERLAKHRTTESCAACHARMDPIGFALENFDVVGGWRDHYRVQKPFNQYDPPWDRWTQGPLVDAAGETVDGQRFHNVDELKKLLLAAPDQLARNLVSQLMVYANGSPLSPADRIEIAEMVRRLSAHRHGVRSTIHEVVQSRAFRGD